jgi:hypothetical protein
MAKKPLNIDKKTKRISKKKYNKEINEAVACIEKGKFVIHQDALKKLAKW